MKDETEKLLSMEQLAEMTGMTEHFIRKARVRYGLPFYKLGIKSVRYRLSEVESWIKQRKVAG